MYLCTFSYVTDQLNGQDRKVNRKNRLHAVPLKKFHSAFCYDINSPVQRIFTRLIITSAYWVGGVRKIAIQTFSSIHAAVG